MAERITNFANIEPPKDKKVLLELRHVDVCFNVRGRKLNAIRDVSLQIYDGESIAIVGESGSGKSVLTKTFAGMLDSNGIIEHGKIIFHDEELSKTNVKLNKFLKLGYKLTLDKINSFTHLEHCSSSYNELNSARKEFDSLKNLSPEESSSFESRLKDIEYSLVNITNEIMSLDRKDKNDQVKFKELKDKIYELNSKKKNIKSEMKALKKKKKEFVKSGDPSVETLRDKVISLERKYAEELKKDNEIQLTDKENSRNDILVKEAVLSFGRYPLKTRFKFFKLYVKKMKEFMKQGKDLSNPKTMDKIYDGITFRVDYISEDNDMLYGRTIVDCSKVKYTKDWQKIRGCKIATVFQDPMTSLNPIIPIGRQIMTVIIKHQKCSESTAKKRALDMMSKVGIPDPEKRFNDYPFQYSGGMRQRIVIAIALSCQPKILICDEPTTALDVTIQAQIIRLIKDLSKQLGFTTVYITHDLGVVANVAERVAVLYGGQIIELGTVEDIFYEPKHPYTWALLSSLPQLTERGNELFSIPGTPPSLYNKIVGDAFAPRSNYALAIDYKSEPPMFKVNDHHYAKTWLLDDRAPKIKKPEIICNLHEKMIKIYGINDKKGGNKNGK